MKTKIIQTALYVTINLFSMYAHAAHSDVHDSGRVMVDCFDPKKLLVIKSHDQEMTSDEMEPIWVRESDTMMSQELNKRLGARGVYKYLIFYENKLIGGMSSDTTIFYDEQDYPFEKSMFDRAVLNQLRNHKRQNNSKSHGDSSDYESDNDWGCDLGGQSTQQKNGLVAIVFSVVQGWFGFSSSPLSGIIVKRS